MNPQTSLELKGTLQIFPFAELLAEISQAKFDGSLRLAHDDRKIIVYFKSGEIIFTVSNARTSRLFDILLRENRIDKKTLADNPNFANDIEFAKSLVEKSLFSQTEIDFFLRKQMQEIIRTAIYWKTGEWDFSPLVRIKDGIDFKVSFRGTAVEYARTMSNETIFPKFKTTGETFSADFTVQSAIAPLPQEVFVLSRFIDSEMTIEEVKALSGFPEDETCRILYTLWLGGFLIRRNHNGAFSKEKIEAISSAKLELKKQIIQPKPVIVPPPPPPVVEPKIEAPIQEEVKDQAVLLAEYLERIEKSSNHYEILDITVQASTSDIKQSYFHLAKQFHPDRFHKNADLPLLRRIQNAFTEIAKAYDTLKNKEIRDAYDYKMRKELAQMEDRKVSGISDAEVNQQEQKDMATENFDQGFNLLMEENFTEAVPYLSRAVHLAPQVARFHAYLGKVLSYSERHRHKAEAELQLAIKLEEKNPTFRIMLAEFFIQYNLLKRAEGELKRFLAIEPDNKEVKALLDNLTQK